MPKKSRSRKQQHPEPLTLETLWNAIPKAWLFIGAIGGVALKLCSGVNWYKDTIIERPEFEAKIADVKREFGSKLDENRSATERLIANVSDKIVAHSDSNHADMEVKWSAVTSKLDMMSSQVSATQGTVQQILLSTKK